MLIQKFVVEIDGGEQSLVLGATADLRELLVVNQERRLTLVPIDRCHFSRPLFGMDDQTFQHLFLSAEHK